LSSFWRQKEDEEEEEEEEEEKGWNNHKERIRRKYVLERTNPPISLILFNKRNSLQTYGIAQNCRITHRMVQRFSQHNLKISYRRHI
jgi:hypothetical protein